MSDPKNLFAILTALLMTGGTIWYCYIFAKGEVKPSLASWFLFSVATGLAFSAYTAGKHDFVSNAANTSDSLSCVLAFLFIWHRGNWHRGVSQTSKYCLWTSGFVVAFWLITRSHDFTNLAAQTILVVAYIPTIEKLWKNPESREPAGPWIAFCLASCLSLIPAFSLESNVLAKTYAVRAAICTGFLVLVNLRAAKLAPAQKETVR